MVFQIECSDEKGEHVELRADGTIRLFGTHLDQIDNAIVLSERQTIALKAMVLAEAEMLKVKR